MKCCWLKLACLLNILDVSVSELKTDRGKSRCYLDPLRKKLRLPTKCENLNVSSQEITTPPFSGNEIPSVGTGSFDSDEYSDEEREYESEYEEEKEKVQKPRKDILAGLKHKLGIPPINKVFRSSKLNDQKNEAEAKLNSLVVCSLLTNKKTNSQPIKMCLPPSLGKWKEKKQIKETNGTVYSSRGVTTCDVNIPEFKAKKRIASWEALDKKFKEDFNPNLLHKFPKGTRPPTLCSCFSDAAIMFAEKCLIHEKTYDNFISKIAFFQEHPDVNEILLEHAVTIATLAREDCSSDIPNPIEMNEGFFDKPNKTEVLEHGSDYTLFIPMGDHHTGTGHHVKLSGDPEESKLDYYREDSMFHAFHALFHRIFYSLKQRRYDRTFELFFYTHQQIMRRNAIERNIQGLPPVAPLDPPEFGKPLGPGYTPGWYAWENLGGRVDDCEIKKFNSSYIKILKKKYAKIQKNMEKTKKFEKFGKKFEKRYHTSGHNYVAEACSSIYNVSADTGVGLMSYSEVSARDPIFYRWHAHIEDIVQQFRDRNMPRYKIADFELSGGVEVVSVITVIDKAVAATERDLKNLLITHWEHKQIRHDKESTISYNRLNHLNFKYQIRIKNPNREKRKVFIRLWIGIPKDPNKIYNYNPKYMIEMDQFAHPLSGSAVETVDRLSAESAATMKELGTTIESLMDDIEFNGTNQTWCGYPHNLLLPRSTNYDPEEKELGGSFFVLMAFVTNTEQNVTAGSDGIEHMMCGHKDLNTMLDKKPFGFPFDRKISFKLKPEANFVTMSLVKIIYRPEQQNQKDMGKKLEEIQTTTEDREPTNPIQEPGNEGMHGNSNERLEQIKEMHEKQDTTLEPVTDHKNENPNETSEQTEEIDDKLNKTLTPVTEGMKVNSDEIVEQTEEMVNKHDETPEPTTKEKDEQPNKTLEQTEEIGDEQNETLETDGISNETPEETKEMKDKPDKTLEPVTEEIDEHTSRLLKQTVGIDDKPNKTLEPVTNKMEENTKETLEETEKKKTKLNETIEDTKEIRDNSNETLEPVTEDIHGNSNETLERTEEIDEKTNKKLKANPTIEDTGEIDENPKETLEPVTEVMDGNPNETRGQTEGINSKLSDTPEPVTDYMDGNPNESLEETEDAKQDKTLEIVTQDQTEEIDDHKRRERKKLEEKPLEVTDDYTIEKLEPVTEEINTNPTEKLKASTDKVDKNERLTNSGKGILSTENRSSNDSYIGTWQYVDMYWDYLGANNLHN